MSRTPVDSSSTPAPDELVLAELVRPLVQRWRVLVAAPTLLAAAALLLALVWPKSYTAESSFTPEQNSSAGALGSALGGLGGVVGLLGGAMGALPSSSSSPPASPEFFAALLKSQELLDETLASRFDVPGESGVQRTLLEIMRPSGSSPARRHGNARRKLAKQVVTTVDRRTGIVALTVTLADPRLAAAVANRMTGLLNEYNLERRQFSSREQRRFIAGRLAQSEQELRSAERAQSVFLARNRFYNGSAALEEEATRHARDVRMHQELFLGLRKSFEDARIAEVRDTPVLSIIDHATPPDRPANPRPVLWSALAALLGAFGAAVFAFATAARSGPARAAANSATPVPRPGAPEGDPRPDERRERTGQVTTGASAEGWTPAPGL